MIFCTEAKSRKEKDGARGDQGTVILMRKEDEDGAKARGEGAGLRPTPGLWDESYCCSRWCEKKGKEAKARHLGHFRSKMVDDVSIWTKKT